MLEALWIEREGRHYETDEYLRAYAAVVRCSCRWRLDHFTLPPHLTMVSRTCAFCGDRAEIDLRTPGPRPSKRRTDSYQETSCAAIDCGATFEFDHSRHDSRLRVACPACGTLKVLRMRALRVT